MIIMPKISSSHTIHRSMPYVLPAPMILSPPQIHNPLQPFGDATASQTHYRSTCRPTLSAWTSAEDSLLTHLHSQGLSWNPISEHFPSKTPNACRKRYERIMAKQQDNEWDARKFEDLAKAYMEIRKEMWSLLAEKVGECRWEVIEGKCLERGLKGLRNSAKKGLRRSIADRQQEQQQRQQRQQQQEQQQQDLQVQLQMEHLRQTRLQQQQQLQQLRQSPKPQQPSSISFMNVVENASPTFFPVHSRHQSLSSHQQMQTQSHGHNSSVSSLDDSTLSISGHCVPEASSFPSSISTGSMSTIDNMSTPFTPSTSRSFQPSYISAPTTFQPYKFSRPQDTGVGVPDDPMSLGMSLGGPFDEGTVEGSGGAGEKRACGRLAIPSIAEILEYAPS